MNLLFRIGYRAAYRAAAGLVARAPAACLRGRGGDLARRRAARGAHVLPAGAGPARRRHRAGAKRRLAAAVRELREETGIEAEPAELVDLGEFHFEDNRRRITDVLFTWRPPAPVSPVADQREIVWAGFVPAAKLAETPLGQAAQALSGGARASGAERHAPDLARIVAHRAVAGEPAHVRGVEHGLGPPGGRLGVGRLDPRAGPRRRLSKSAVTRKWSKLARSSRSGRKRPGSSGEKWPASISSKARVEARAGVDRRARREAAPAGCCATSSAVRPKMKMLSGPTCSSISMLAPSSVPMVSAPLSAELHVAGARRLHAGGADLLGQIGAGDQDLGQATRCSSAGTGS